MPKLNLVSLSSEQLWPAIHCLSYYGQRVEKLFLLHTKDKAKSINPAKSIGNFATSWLPGIKVVMPDDVPENSPAAVSKTLHDWMDRHPDQEWVINASGGTKLMLLGVLDFINLKNVEVIYRDLTGKPGEIWHSLKRVNEFGFLNNTPVQIPENSTDQIPAETLVKTIWSDSDNFHIAVGKIIQSLDVVKVTQIASLNQWNFKKAFDVAGYPAESTPGQLFEQYVASILLDLGVKNLTCNAIRKSPEGNALGEMDIIANHQGKLTIVDCKMRSIEDENNNKVETLFDQIRKTHQVANELGGLGVKVILLRPNRIFSANEQLLAKSYHIKVFDAPKMPNIIDCLADHFGVGKIPPHLLRVQKIIQGSQENQIYPGMGPAPFKHEWDPQTRSTGIINLNRLLSHIQSDLSQDWSAFELDNVFYLDFPIPKYLLNSPEEDLRSSLHRKTDDMFGSISDVEIIGVFKKRARCELRPASANVGKLRSLLQKRFGRPIL